MGGLFTGSANGIRATSDVTYVMPLEFLLNNMEENGVHSPDVNVGPKEPEGKRKLLEIFILKTSKIMLDISEFSFLETEPVGSNHGVGCESLRDLIDTCSNLRAATRNQGKIWFNSSFEKKDQIHIQKTDVVKYCIKA